MSAEYPLASPEERADRIVTVKDVPAVNLRPGTHTHIVAGENMTLSFITLDAHVHFPVHSHPHEEMIIVLQGELDAILAGRKYRLTAGDVLPVAGGVEHGVCLFDTQCVLIEVFSPAREDFEAKLQQAMDAR